jgi:hypothetical protein
MHRLHEEPEKGERSSFQPWPSQRVHPNQRWGLLDTADELNEIVAKAMWHRVRQRPQHTSAGISAARTQRGHPWPPQPRGHWRSRIRSFSSPFGSGSGARKRSATDRGSGARSGNGSGSVGETRAGG